MTSVLDGTAPQQVAFDSEPATRPSKVKWRLLLPALLLLGFAAHVAWRLWLLRYAPTVVAHADEDRYLLSARALAGGPGGFGNDTEAFRRLGYPALLTPIYWYLQDPFKVYHAAQVVGAVINALTFPLAYLFARRVLGGSRWLSLGMAFVGAALPAVVYYSEFVLTDVLFAPIGLAWLLLIHGWLAGKTSIGRPTAAIGAGVIVGYAYVTHVRGIVMVIVHLGVVAVVLLAKKGKKSWAIASAITALLVTRLDWLAKQAIGNSMEHGGVEPDDKMWSALTTALGMVRTLCDAAGQFWYLGVATGGLGVIGVLVVLRKVRQPGGDFAKRTVLGTLLVATVLIALASAAALPIDFRVSNHAYFRYIAFLAPMWTMIGIQALVEAASRSEKLKLMVHASAFMGASLFVLLARMAPNEWFHPFDTPEVSFLTNSYAEFRPFKASILALVLLALWLVRKWWIPATAMLAVSLAAMTVVNIKAIKPMVADEYLPGSRLVHDLGVTPADVVQTASDVDLGSRLNHQREVTWAPVTEFDTLLGAPSATTTVVIAPWNPYPAKGDDESTHWDGTSQGWTRVYTYENDKRHWAVWRRTGALTQADLNRQILNQK